MTTLLQCNSTFYNDALDALDVAFHVEFGIVFLLLLLFIYLFIYGLFGATPVAYGGSQAWSQIRAVATNHSHSHSNAKSEPHLQPTPQLMPTLHP